MVGPYRVLRSICPTPVLVCVAGFADGPKLHLRAGEARYIASGFRDNGSLLSDARPAIRGSAVPSGEVDCPNRHLPEQVTLAPSTTSGLRMGAISSDGSITYGPILISDATGALAFWGLLFVAGAVVHPDALQCSFDSGVSRKPQGTPSGRLRIPLGPRMSFCPRAGFLFPRYPLECSD